MKRTLITISMALTTAFAGLSVPAKPGIMVLTNPDGSSMECRLHGDEFSHFYTDASGKHLIQRDINGYLQIVEEATESNARKLAKAQGGLMRTQAVVNNGRTSFPTINDNLHCLVVLMQFEDTKFRTQNPREAFGRWLNDEGYSEWGATGSARDFYRACSRGKFNPHFDVSPVVTISMTSAEATKAYPACFDEALKLVAATGEVDFSNYDADNDGEIDFIYFIYAGYGYADTGLQDCIWPHAFQLSPATYNGKQTGSYACSMELRGSHLSADDGCIAGLGTFVHEFGHVLGLPDYYDVGYSGAVTPDEWDTMASGCYNEDSTCPPLFSAFERWMLRWDEIGEGIKVIDAADHIQISRHDETASDARILYSDIENEYYIFECRSKEGWDAGLPDEGLLIWHIAYSDNVWNSNTVNTDGVSRCAPLRTGTESSSCAFPDGACRTFLSPHSFGMPLTDGTNMPNTVTGISFDGENCVFDVDLCSEPEITTRFLGGEIYAEGKKNSGIRLYWEPVRDAKGYEITLVRTNKQGHEYIMGEADALNVGTATSFEVSGLTESQTKQDWKATVRVMFDLPASIESEPYHFIPAELTGIAKVENVHVGNGKESVYNTNGLKAHNLSRGINIVVSSDGNIKKIAN